MFIQTHNYKPHNLCEIQHPSFKDMEKYSHSFKVLSLAISPIYTLLIPPKMNVFSFCLVCPFDAGKQTYCLAATGHGTDESE